jgi:hypothetical protein
MEKIESNELVVNTNKYADSLNIVIERLKSHSEEIEKIKCKLV